MQCTIMMALLQPARETYDLFDDVILLAAGVLIFHPNLSLFWLMVRQVYA